MRYKVPTNRPAPTAYAVPIRPRTFAEAANAMIPAAPSRSAVDVNETRRIIHGASTSIVAITTMRSATGGRRRNVNATAPIAAHATAWRTYNVMPYHGRLGRSAYPTRITFANIAGATTS